MQHNEVACVMWSDVRQCVTQEVIQPKDFFYYRVRGSNPQQNHTNFKVSWGRYGKMNVTWQYLCFIWQAGYCCLLVRKLFFNFIVRSKNGSRVPLYELLVGWQPEVIICEPQSENRLVCIFIKPLFLLSRVKSNALWRFQHLMDAFGVKMMERRKSNITDLYRD